MLNTFIFVITFLVFASVAGVIVYNALYTIPEIKADIKKILKHLENDDN